MYKAEEEEYSHTEKFLSLYVDSYSLLKILQTFGSFCIVQLLKVFPLLLFIQCS